MSEDDDLFRPLSAKVQPKAARWSTGGREMDPKRQLIAARKSKQPKAAGKREKGGAKQDG